MEDSTVLAQNIIKSEVEAFRLYIGGKQNENIKSFNQQSTDKG